MQAPDFNTWLVNFLTDPSTTKTIGSFVALGIIALVTTFKFYKDALKSYIKSKFQFLTRQEHRMNKDYSLNAMHVNQKLQTLREKIDCSRICVIQFRDGSQFTLSEPMFRIYCTYEALRNGVHSCARSFSDLLGTSIISIIGPILDDRMEPAGTTLLKLCPHKKCPKTRTPPRVVKIDTDAMQFDTARNLLEENGVRHMYALPLYSGTSPIGFMMLHYIVDLEREPIVADHICEICETAHYVQQMLDRNMKSPS